MNHETPSLGLEACITLYTYLVYFLDQTDATIEFLRIDFGGLGAFYSFSDLIFVLSMVASLLREIVANVRT